MVQNLRFSLNLKSELEGKIYVEYVILSADDFDFERLKSL
jgi:hypothetical protein